MNITLRPALAVAALLASAGASAADVHTSDFIPDASRTGFNGFELIPNDGTSYLGGAGPYAEGGISVEQVHGDTGNDIWVTYRPPGGEGNFGWYPNGGDFGYTKLTLTGGGSFSSVGMLIASGFGVPGSVAYELWNGGTRVGSGNIAPDPSGVFHYLGFSGGGFDTILLADGFGSFAIGDGQTNALTLDAIEITGAVPEPTGYAMMALGLAAIGGLARRRKA